MCKYIDAEKIPFVTLDSSKDPLDYVRRVAIDMMPTADVVEVVRCRDCKYLEKWYTEVDGDTGYYCILRPNQQTCNLMPEDYCSYGVRKDD